jgi:predicted ArsR family transcriptional regulator
LAAPRAAGPRKPREGTKQQRVIALLRRPEGATVAQIAEATAWQPHTIHGFFAGLRKRGIEVAVLERVRQVGAGRERVKGSYTVYQVTE